VGVGVGRSTASHSPGAGVSPANGGVAVSVAVGPGEVVFPVDPSSVFGESPDPAPEQPARALPSPRTPRRRSRRR